LPASTWANIPIFLYCANSVIVSTQFCHDKNGAQHTGSERKKNANFKVLWEENLKSR